jgi:hypothetical protein
MRFLFPVVGYTLLDEKRSTVILSELKIFNLAERIDKKTTGANRFEEWQQIDSQRYY